MRRSLTLTIAVLISLVAARAVPPEAGGHPGSSGTTGASNMGTNADGTVAATNAIKTFQIQGGLKAELFAAEPLLKNPVSFAQDSQGRWYVAESFRQEHGIEDNRAHAPWLETDLASRTVEDRLAMMHKFYPDPAKFAEKFTTFEDRISRVEDSNGDGKADRTTVFADGFREPLDGTGAGILVRGDDVWWTSIPHLWHFKVPEGDAKAEVREKLLSGFGVHFAFRGHDMHGLKFGPDGKLYFSIGDRGIHVQTKEGATVAEQDTGSVMRCNPDGTDFEVFCIGIRNPQELAFDEYGNLFTGDNNSDSGDKARFAYLVEGGDSGWRMGFQYLTDRGPWNREKLWDDVEGAKAKYIIPPVVDISNGPAGLVYNPGTGLNDTFKGKFFLSDFRGSAAASVVHEIGIKPEGAFFKMSDHRELIKGILTTDVDIGNDGALYVLDWVESWGGVGKGRIYKFTAPNANVAQQEAVKKLIEEGMSKRPEGELGKLLEHPDMRIRQAAQFELAGRGEKGASIFAKVAAPGNQKLARLHAIWGLGQQAAASKDQKGLTQIASLLRDSEPEVRVQAAHVLGDHHYAASASTFVELLKDSNSRVRFHAAMALGKIKHPAAFEPLCAMLAENNDKDPIIRHGGVMGLVGCATVEQLAGKSSDKSTSVKYGALLALRRLKSPEIARFLSDPDPAVLLETARAIYDVPIEGALPALAQLTKTKGLKDSNLLLRVLNAHYRLGHAENAAALASYAAESSSPESARRVAIEALADWAHPSAQDRVLNLFRPLAARGPEEAVTAVSAAIPALLKDAPGSVQEMAAHLAAKLSIKSAGDALYSLALNSKASKEARIAAIQALATFQDARLPQLAREVVKDKDPAIRVEGLQSLAASDPAGAVKLIADVINSGSALEKQGALAALTQVHRPEASALLSALLDQLSTGGTAPEIQLDLLEAARKSDSAEVKAKLRAYEASLPASDPLAPYRVSMSGGDASRGRKIFREKVEVQCIRCHRCEIGDSQVGPDLTHIGATKDRNYLLESVVFPNKRIAEGFETVVLTLKDKSMLVGRLSKSDSTALQIETMDEKGKPKSVTVPVDQVADRQSAPSPMPETIRDSLTKAELRDVIEYLATRK